MKFSKTAAACAATAVIAVTASAAMPALAAKRPTVSTAVASPTVYQGKITGKDIVLGPQSDPSLLVRTALLPAGTYLVTYSVGAVIASHDQIVCAASNVVPGNDGLFGTAGNPGTGFIYGTATETDTIKVSAGQRVSVGCNSFNYGKGTWVGAAVVEAVPVAAVH